MSNTDTPVTAEMIEAGLRLYLNSPSSSRAENVTAIYRAMEAARPTTDVSTYAIPEGHIPVKIPGDKEAYLSHTDVSTDGLTPQVQRYFEQFAKEQAATIEALQRSNAEKDEVAWLIEWPADRQSPTRYYSAGEPPVIDPSHALRFARKEDAEAFMKGWVATTRVNITGAKAVEHMWCKALSHSSETSK